MTCPIDYSKFNPLVAVGGVIEDNVGCDFFYYDANSLDFQKLQWNDGIGEKYSKQGRRTGSTAI